MGFMDFFCGPFPPQWMLPFQFPPQNPFQFCYFQMSISHTLKVRVGAVSFPWRESRLLSGTHSWLQWRNVLVSSLSAAGKIGECDKHFILQALFTSVKLLSEEVCCTRRLWGVQRWLGCLSHSKRSLECFFQSGQPLQKFHCAKPCAPVTSREDRKKWRQNNGL